ncbi:hypothetical protein [Lysobacter capsici]|uniref:hypothetical protein n=1 Tax=Lysobacter capsici TaxID=435897 RepID=UPI001C0018EF|nr:hypothetical protein [Lysobacter capsici]QWF18720.1 hypothetical protein KME82_08250 [Lysobacter capsici]
MNTANAMRTAFDAATTNTPKTQRTRLYAMVRSALNRKIGLTFHRSAWSMLRGKR